MQVIAGLVLFAAGAVLCSGDKFAPMVAFVCDRGSMHMHEDGKWVADPTTDCMEGKDEILAYCKKSYPTLDVTNIVESSEYKHIKGWCALGKTDCGAEEAFKVRPFRCLTGPFQSDALVVPKKCVFDHVHQPKQCHGFDWWSDVAHKACRGLKHMKTEHFAMLLPCGTDVFTGVEYVCCPDESQANNTETTTVDAKLELPVISVKVAAPGADVSSKNIEAELKVVDNYMHMKAEAYRSNEHDAFTLAKKELVKLNHDKITKLMKDWGQARKRVLDLKAVDPKGAEKLNKEITPRFQKEYFALQTSSDSKVLQLDSIHQQHVQANLDSKKRKTVEKLMHELQADQPEPAAITKFLKRYISIEEKDAHHCIHHYTKIRDRDAKQGQQMLPATITHLVLISTRINQSIDLLNTLDSNNTKTKILQEVTSWRSKTFNSVDKYITSLKAQLVAADHVTKPPRTTTMATNTVKVEMEKNPVITVEESKSAKPSGGMYRQFADKFAAKAALLKPAKVQTISLKEEAQKEDEHKYNKVKSPQVNHLSQGVLMSAESNLAVAGQQSTTSNLSVGAGVAITVGVIAGVLVLVFSLVIAKKRAANTPKPSQVSYVEVSADDKMSAEERHIASMQNGYENPTYKFLEKKAMQA